MKSKVIEIITGYISKGKLGHVQSSVDFGLPSWQFPKVYKYNPNPDKFRKVRITVKEVI